MEDEGSNLRSQNREAKDHDVVAPIRLEESQLLDLHIQEYVALRAEQRTRLDSANKIINYYLLILAAIAAGVVSLYNTRGAEFLPTFRFLLLLTPLVTLPFAFTQQNEEIFVRHIGGYLADLKGKITDKTDPRFWNWEHYHADRAPFILRLTGFFRAALLMLFSALDLLVYYSLFSRPTWPWVWLARVKLFSGEFVFGILLVFDLLLLLGVIFVGIRMSRAMTIIRQGLSRLRERWSNLLGKKYTS